MKGLRRAKFGQERHSSNWKGTDVGSVPLNMCLIDRCVCRHGTNDPEELFKHLRNYFNGRQHLSGAAAACAYRGERFSPSLTVNLQATIHKLNDTLREKFRFLGSRDPFTFNAYWQVCEALEQLGLPQLESQLASVPSSDGKVECGIQLDHLAVRIGHEVILRTHELI